MSNSMLAMHLKATVAETAVLCSRAPHHGELAALVHGSAVVPEACADNGDGRHLLLFHPARYRSIQHSQPSERLLRLRHVVQAR